MLRLTERELLTENMQIYKKSGHGMCIPPIKIYISDNSVIWAPDNSHMFLKISKTRIVDIVGTS